VTLLQATHLLNDRSVEVQKMAYQLLHRSAKKRTEYIVIEAGVSGPDSDSIKPELPPELIAFLQRSIDEEDPDAPPTFGYLLGWMSVFDLFVDAVSTHIQRFGCLAHLSNCSVPESEDRVYQPPEGLGDDHLSLPPRGVPYVRPVFRQRQRSETGCVGNRRVLRSMCVLKDLSC